MPSRILADRDLDETDIRVAAVDVLAAWSIWKQKQKGDRPLFQRVVDTYDTWRQNVDPTRITPRPWRNKRRPPLSRRDMEVESSEESLTTSIEQYGV